jgi:hypothetical protein
VLVTRLNRLFTLTFSRSWGVRYMLPQILYLLQAKTGQSHTKCTRSSLSYPHSRHSCRSVCPNLYKWALRLVWLVNSPTAALSLSILIARCLLAVLGRGYLISILDCWKLVQAVHLSWCLSSNCFLMSFFTFTKGYSSELVRRDFSSPFLGQFVGFLVAQISALKWRC